MSEQGRPDIAQWRYRARTARQAPSMGQAYSNLVRDLIVELERTGAGEVRTEWGVRWPDCLPGEDVEDDAGCRDGGESYARNIARLHAEVQLVKREVRTVTAEWQDAT